MSAQPSDTPPSEPTASDSPAAESSETPTSEARPSRLKSVLLGTAVAAVAALGTFQVLRADAAKSSTEPTANAAKPPVARVNGELIAYAEVADECVARHGAEVLDNLINRRLILQACRGENVSVTDAEILQKATEDAKKFNLPLDTWYQMLLSERKLTRTQYHRDVLWPMLALQKLAGKTVQVTDADMQQAFERDYGPRVKARLIAVDGNQRQATRVWEMCQKSPEAFDKIAREHSADPNSRPLGGVIPPIRRHLGDAKFEQAAFALAEGEISDLIQMPDGQWVILKCEGRTEPVVTAIDDVYTELLAQQKEEKTQLAVAQVFERIREQAQVINHLTGTATGTARTGGSGMIRQAGATMPAK